MMIIFLILGFVAIYYVATYFGVAKKKTDSPLDILKDRFARGEIDRTEYERMKNVIIEEELYE